jgi:hypothetical protein
MACASGQASDVVGHRELAAPIVGVVLEPREPEEEVAANPLRGQALTTADLELDGATEALDATRSVGAALGVAAAVPRVA